MPENNSQDEDVKKYERQETRVFTQIFLGLPLDQE